MSKSHESHHVHNLQRVALKIQADPLRVVNPLVDVTVVGKEALITLLKALSSLMMLRPNQTHKRIALWSPRHQINEDGHCDS